MAAASGRPHYRGDLHRAPCAVLRAQLHHQSQGRAGLNSLDIPPAAQRNPSNPRQSLERTPPPAQAAVVQCDQSVLQHDDLFGVGAVEVAVAAHSPARTRPAEEQPEGGDCSSSQLITVSAVDGKMKGWELVVCR